MKLPEKTGCFNSRSSIIQAVKEKKNDNECILETSKKLLKIDFPYIMLQCETQLSPGLLGLEECSVCSFGNSVMRLPPLVLMDCMILSLGVCHRQGLPIKLHFFRWWHGSDFASG